MNSVERDYFNGHIWDNKDADGANFQIAFGITEQGYPNQGLPKNAGTIKAYYRFWDWASDPIIDHHIEIKTKECTLKELGLDPPEIEDSAEGDEGDEGGEGGETRRLADEDESEETEEAKDSLQQFFQPIDSQSRLSLETYQQRLLCIDENSIILEGNTETIKGQSLVIMIEPCD